MACTYQWISDNDTKVMLTNVSCWQSNRLYSFIHLNWFLRSHQRNIIVPIASIVFRMTQIIYNGIQCAIMQIIGEPNDCIECDNIIGLRNVGR